MSELIINGGFETGDLTGWEHSGCASWDNGCVAVCPATEMVWINGVPHTINYPVHSGTYACELTHKDDYAHFSYLSQEITNPNILTFWYYPPTGQNYGYFEVFIDDTKVWGITSSSWSAGVWTQRQLDLSAYTGQHTLSFHVQTYGEYTVIIFLDDVSCSAVASNRAKRAAAVLDAFWGKRRAVA